MTVCDVCSVPGVGTIVRAGDFRTAVSSGFDPYSLGLAKNVTAQFLAVSDDACFQNWKSQMVDPPGATDWNVCTGCMRRLASYLPSAVPVMKSKPPAPPKPPRAQAANQPAAGGGPSSTDTIRFACPKCSNKMRAAGRHVGKKTKCKSCGTALTIPFPSAKARGAVASPLKRPAAFPEAAGQATASLSREAAHAKFKEALARISKDTVSLMLYNCCVSRVALKRGIAAEDEARIPITRLFERLKALNSACEQFSQGKKAEAKATLERMIASGQCLLSSYLTLALFDLAEGGRVGSIRFALKIFELDALMHLPTIYDCVGEDHGEASKWKDVLDLMSWVWAALGDPDRPAIFAQASELMNRVATDKGLARSSSVKQQIDSLQAKLNAQAKRK